MISQKLTSFIVKVMEDYIIVSLALAPLVAIGYIHYFTVQPMEVEFSLVHEATMVLASVASVFIAYVALKNYRDHGNPVLRYIGLGFYGFGMIYALHGILTEGYDDNYVAFFMYSSVAHLIVAIYVAIGLFLLNRNPDSETERHKVSKWLPHFIFFVLLDVAVLFISKRLPFMDEHMPLSVNIVEGAALVLTTLAVIYILALKVKTPILRYYAWTFVFLAEACFAALISKPWDSLWWFSHMLWAAGFSILCYAIIAAYKHGGSLESIYGIDALLAQLSEAKAEIKVKDTELRDYVDRMSTYNAKIDPKGILLFANKSMLAASGINEGDLSKAKFLDLKLFNYNPEVNKRLREAFDLAAAKGENVNYEERIQPVDGSAIYVALSLSPVKDSQHNVSYILAEAKDITEQVEAEEKIQSANQELENMNKMMIGREVKMAEMKRELEELRSKSGAV